eukprot:TRINITY_DN1492_c0_g1_i3.p1 TRINITY_DN1492_c0_g1~~TRINITY_DN1492_c0_g1_i3.p1  ORF type:complete len:133 (-),score=14.27 TRINITY_DN1492_c0_g1_i3:75-473(-)
MSPNRLIHSFNREVILRRPEEFKIACLNTIKALFPENPFYAGFGNRDTDSLSYTAVEMSEGKIFKINPLGSIVTVANILSNKSYIKLNELVHEMFPPLDSETKSTVPEMFNDFQYWKPTPYNLNDIEKDFIS